MARFSSAPLAAELYEQGLTQQEIADELGVNQSTIHKWLVRTGIELKSRSHAHRTAQQRKRLQKQREGTLPSGVGHPWTATEDEILIHNPEQPASDIATQIGRTVNAIHQRRFQLRKASRPVDVCVKCGHRHPYGRPSWYPRAEELYLPGQRADGTYRFGLSCTQVSQALKQEGIIVSDHSVHFWLQHEGVSRPASSEKEKGAVARMALITRGKPVRKDSKKSRCQCRPDCKDDASGEWYWDGGPGKWRQVIYAPGHQPRKGPAPSQVDRSHLASHRFADRVDMERLARGWSLPRLTKEARVDWKILYNNKPRPESVLGLARVISIEDREALELAGIPSPSALQWIILERMLKTGERRQDIASKAGVDKQVVNYCLRNNASIPSDENLEKLGRELGIGTEQLESVRSTRQRRRPSPESYEGRRRQVDEGTLRLLLLQQGMSEPGAAKRLGVSMWVVHDRSVRWKLREAHIKRLRARRRQVKPLSDHNKVQSKKLLVRAAVEELLRNGESPTFTAVWEESAKIDASGEGCTKPTVAKHLRTVLRELRITA